MELNILPKGTNIYFMSDNKGTIYYNKIAISINRNDIKSIEVEN